MGTLLFITRRKGMHLHRCVYVCVCLYVFVLKLPSCGVRRSCQLLLRMCIKLPAIVNPGGSMTVDMAQSSHSHIQWYMQKSCVHLCR